MVIEHNMATNVARVLHLMQ